MFLVLEVRDPNPVPEDPAPVLAPEQVGVGPVEADREPVAAVRPVPTMNSWTTKDLNLGVEEAEVVLVDRDRNHDLRNDALSPDLRGQKTLKSLFRRRDRKMNFSRATYQALCY